VWNIHSVIVKEEMPIDSTTVGEERAHNVVVPLSAVSVEPFLYLPSTPLLRLRNQPSFAPQSARLLAQLLSEHHELWDDVVRWLVLRQVGSHIVAFLGIGLQVLALVGVLRMGARGGMGEPVAV
jgi:hypothetical protein